MLAVGVVFLLLSFVPGWTLWLRVPLGIVGALLVLSGWAVRSSAKAKERERLEEKEREREAQIRELEAQIREREAREWQAYLAGIVATIKAHAATLRRKRRQLTRVDDYGNVFTEAWDKEVTYFVEHTIIPATDQSQLTDDVLRYAREMVEWVSEHQPENGTPPDVGSMSPTEYEHYCADLLRAAGWDARVTTASGDQGVDVVATRDGETLVVQAKRYSGSVGNAAVQEAIAGKEFIGADKAAVVSPATFTKSAIELANTTGVLLLHHEQLAEL